ncbi:MAG: carbamoyltransferase C-terminal domain-containing protein [Candidatus Altiarchaeota archaeon]|nr:carbamoyltransferase C-terminal domain-containing protein [Candidatus Altiarchaeota archaeon]
MRDSTKIIGIHDNHNAAVCLLEDGVIRFAIQEERLNGIKNYNGFPHQALNVTLEHNNLDVEDIDLFTFSFKHNPPQRTKEELLQWYRLSEKNSSNLIELFRQSPLFTLYKQRNRKKRLKHMKKAGIPEKKAVFTDHHLTHAASAYYGSFYDKGDNTLVLTLDGGGDGLCSTVSTAKNGRINRIAETREGNSLGELYAYTTFCLGMSPLEHEYKLMGMAPYTKKDYFSGIYKRLRGIMDVEGLSFKRNSVRSTMYAYPYLKKIYELERFDNISGAIQRFTEDLIVKWVTNAIHKTKIRNLALAGGVFMNVKANRRIMELDDVDNLYVFPSSGDESCAIGSAYQAYAGICQENGGDVEIKPTEGIYYGLQYSDSDIESGLEGYGLDYCREKNIEKSISEELARNNIVARFYGRNEWGSRALGNRSILANASNFLNINKLNNAIKMRDFWMPFAPSILEERQHEYLINPKNIKSPYMTMAFNTSEKRGDIIAAIHPKDHSARPQLVDEEHNASYHRLLKYYEGLTGYGGILNTSFNLHGQPMVCSPKDALDTFINSGLEYLAIGNYLVVK